MCYHVFTCGGGGYAKVGEGDTAGDDVPLDELAMKETGFA